MKRFAFALLAFGVLVSGVQAQQRLSTLGLTCGQAQQIIRSRGAAVLSTGAHTYDRFVSDRSFCEFDEGLELALVPTRDTPQCPIGYRCQTQLDWFDD